MLTTPLRRAAAGLVILAAAAILAFAPAASAAGAGTAHDVANHRGGKHLSGKHLSGKHKPAARVATVRPTAGACPGEAQFRCGPLDFSGTYLGDDPDPNIRFQIWRDLGARFGGED